MEYTAKCLNERSNFCRIFRSASAKVRLSNLLSCRLGNASGSIGVVLITYTTGMSLVLTFNRQHKVTMLARARKAPQRAKGSPQVFAANYGLPSGLLPPISEGDTMSLGSTTRSSP